MVLGYRKNKALFTPSYPLLPLVPASGVGLSAPPWHTPGQGGARAGGRRQVLFHCLRCPPCRPRPATWSAPSALLQGGEHSCLKGVFSTLVTGVGLTKWTSRLPL